MFIPERPKYDRSLRSWFNAEALKILSSISVSNEDKTLERVALLKRLDDTAGNAFKQYIEESAVLDDGKKQLILRVAFKSNFTGVKDGSDTFFEVPR